MKRYPKIKAYYYSGFNEPELLATSVTGLLTNVEVSSNYLGDVTTDFRLDVKEFKNTLDMEQFKEDMSQYDIYINPDISEFQERNLHSYGLDENSYLENFK